MKKPVIGLTPLFDPEKDSYWMLPGYLRGLEEAGAVPVILPPRMDRDATESVLALCDGLLFTGGQDVDPRLYGQTAQECTGPLCPERDSLEAVLLPLALERDIPVLGICRGIQLINAVLGGTLYQDLPREHPSQVNHRMERPYDGVAHWVHLISDSPLAKLLGRERLGVNSCHHQAIRDLAPPLREMARSEDGIPEAVWLPGKTFVWAVQWHPEMALDTNPAGPAVFRAFTRAAQAYMNRRCGN